MHFRALLSGRLVLGCALWLLAASAPTLTSCATSSKTAQQRKTERYKRKAAKSNHIPCPTKDC